MMDALTELTPRQRTLLTFLQAGDGGKLDPIRIQKGLFILAMETPEEWLPSEARYHFEPYNYGPYSSEIYYDLDRLEGYGYVEKIEMPGRSWKNYSLTPTGFEAGHNVIEGMDSRVVEYATTLRDYVGKLPFGKLLDRVYERYPEYAINSVFKR